MPSTLSKIHRMTTIKEQELPITWSEFILDEEAVHNLYQYYCDDYDSDDEHVRPRGADSTPEKSMMLQYIGGFRKNSMVDIDDAVEMYISTYYYKHNRERLEENLRTVRLIKSMVTSYRARLQMLGRIQVNSAEDKWQIRTMKVCECVTRSLDSLREIAQAEEEEENDDRDEEFEAYVNDEERGDWVQTGDDGSWMHIHSGEIWNEMEHKGMLPWAESGDTDMEDDDGVQLNPGVTVSRWSGMKGTHPKNFALPPAPLHTGTKSNAKVQPKWRLPASMRGQKVDVAKAEGRWFAAPPPPT
jgi:hypothetical protein